MGQGDQHANGGSSEVRAVIGASRGRSIIPNWRPSKMMQRRKHFKILSLKGRLRVSSMVVVGGNPGEWHSWMERVTSLEEQRVCEWGGGTDQLDLVPML